MKKKKSNVKKPEAQKIEINYAPGRMIFSVNGSEFFITEEEANFIFGRNVQIAFESIVGRKGEDFSDLNTKEFIAKFQVVSSHLRSLNEMAKFLEMDPMRLRGWLNDEMAKRTIRDFSKIPEMPELMKKFKEELFPEDLKEEKKEEKFWPDASSSSFKKTASMLLDGRGPREISEKLKVPYDKFLRWYTNKEIQNVLTRLSGEEFDKRRRATEEREQQA